VLFLCLGTCLLGLVFGCTDIMGNAGTEEDESISDSIDDPDSSSNDDNNTNTSYLYSGFKDLSFSVDDYWEYTWTYEQTINGTQEPTESGIMRIELVSSLLVTFDVIGE